MTYLKTLIDDDVFNPVRHKKPNSFEKRVTVKAIVKNSAGKFALITNPIHKQYLLPGGGAESVDLELEIQRECEEEIGFSVEVIEEVGKIHEYRNREAKEYVTTCFRVDVKAPINEDLRTENEKENGLLVEWFSSDEVLEILSRQVQGVKEGKIGFYNTAFNIVRDTLFFQQHLKN